jgi:hypothetical protein
MNRTTRHTLAAFAVAWPPARLAALDDADHAPFRTAEVPTIGREQTWNTQTLEMTEDIA